MSDDRKPFSPAEFDEACRELLRRCPDLSCTSGGRSIERNERVGGHPLSKHRIDMARDYVGPKEAMRLGATYAKAFGLWFLLHDAGSGAHLHVQGLPPGEIPAEWRSKYLED